VVTELGNRSRTGLRGALRRGRGGVALAGQASLAAGLAWFVAHTLIGTASPYFAPIAAVITLASSVGQRLRRTTELVIGVALCIGMGDALVLLIGTGPWQIGLIVLLAVLVATTLGGGTSLVVQAASSAVLVATLTPNTGQPWTRFVDALIGGGIALLVMTVVLPLNPLSVVRRAADPALQVLANGLHELSAAMRARDAEGIDRVLEQLRAADRLFTGFQDAVAAARENVAFAPARWRNRTTLAEYVDGADHVTWAARNIRVLIRRAHTAVNDDEKIPDCLPESLGLLGDAVDLLRQEWAKGVEPAATRERALAAAAEAGKAYSLGVGFSGGVVVAQVRTAATDLLRATGIDHNEAPRMVRNAVGWRMRRRGSRKRSQTRLDH
jgi:uncharacterized membrane protein YgaE (UPF0421/DUF939 family)